MDLNHRHAVLETAALTRLNYPHVFVITVLGDKFQLLSSDSKGATSGRLRSLEQDVRLELTASCLEGRRSTN